MIIAELSRTLVVAVLVVDHQTGTHQTVAAHLDGRAHVVEAVGFVFPEVDEVASAMAVAASVRVVVFN
jgi:hypothetical protein